MQNTNKELLVFGLETAKQVYCKLIAEDPNTLDARKSVVGSWAEDMIQLCDCLLPMQNLEKKPLVTIALYALMAASSQGRAALDIINLLVKDVAEGVQRSLEVEYAKPQSDD